MGIIVQYCEKELGIHQQTDRWTLQGQCVLTLGIVDRNIASLLCFLVELATIFRCPFEIPYDVSVAITCSEVVNGVTQNKTTVHKVTDQKALEKLEGLDGIVSVT